MEANQPSVAPPSEKVSAQVPLGVAGATSPAASQPWPDGMEPAPPPPAAPIPARRGWRRRVLLGTLGIAGLAVCGYFLVPWVVTALNTVSTDDAYVNSHVTFVAPRVKGQVVRVLVDDNYRVKQGDLLVQLDKKPYQVAVDQKKAALDMAQAKLVQARATTRATAATARALRYRAAQRHAAGAQDRSSSCKGTWPR